MGDGGDINDLHCFLTPSLVITLIGSSQKLQKEKARDVVEKRDTTRQAVGEAQLPGDVKLEPAPSSPCVPDIVLILILITPILVIILRPLRHAGGRSFT